MLINYNCRKVITVKACEAILEWDQHSKDRLNHPELYLGLAQFLRSKKLAYATIPHLIARLCFHEHSCIRNVNFIDMKDVPRRFIEDGVQYMEYQDVKFMVAYFRDRMMPLATNFLAEVWRVIEPYEDHPEDDPDRPREIGPKAIFNDWLNKQLREVENSERYCASVYRLGLYK